jgi:hypothetical protein
VHFYKVGLKIVERPLTHYTGQTVGKSSDAQFASQLGPIGGILGTVTGLVGGTCNPITGIGAGGQNW